MILTEIDLASGGMEMPWTHTRAMVNQMDANVSFGNGNNWLPMPSTCYLKEVDGTPLKIAVVMSPQDTYWFEQNGSDYDPIQGIKEELEVDETAGTITCSRPDGTVCTFHEFSQADGGLLDSITSRGGSTIEFSYTDGKISEVTRTSGTTTESFFQTPFPNVQTRSECCPLRDLFSSLFGRSKPSDQPQGDGVQHGRANMPVPGLRKRDLQWLPAGHTRSPSLAGRSRKQHDNINLTKVLGPRTPWR